MEIVDKGEHKNEIVLTARSLIDTPYLHQGRLPGVGIDCIGVPIVVAKELGLGDFDVAFPELCRRADYPRTPNGTMVQFIQQVCAPLDDLHEGALLVFNISDEPQHCAIASRYMDGWGMIHAWDIVGKVVEHRLTGNWRSALVGIYALPGAAKT